MDTSCAWLGAMKPASISTGMMEETVLLYLITLMGGLNKAKVPKTGWD
jgi:hypothetical protein